MRLFQILICAARIGFRNLHPFLGGNRTGAIGRDAPGSRISALQPILQRQGWLTQPSGELLYAHGGMAGNQFEL